MIRRGIRELAYATGAVPRPPEPDVIVPAQRRDRDARLAYRSEAALMLMDDDSQAFVMLVLKGSRDHGGHMLIFGDTGPEYAPAFHATFERILEAAR